MIGAIGINVPYEMRSDKRSYKEFPNHIPIMRSRNSNSQFFRGFFRDLPHGFHMFSCIFS